jgi:hypothetical protein
MKTCNVCKKDKECNDFYKSPLNKDGYEGKCKVCKSLYIKDKWTNDPSFKEKHSQYYLKNLKYIKSNRKFKCTKCDILVYSKTAPNLTGLCRTCAKKTIAVNWTQKNLNKKAAHTAKRRAKKLQATPPWLTNEQFKEIEEFYILAKELQWLNDPLDPLEVDHIMPLQGKNSCGLHVPWNLQILPKSLNCSKGNR